MNRGRIVWVDTHARSNLPAVTCIRCGGGEDGLTLVDGRFVHRDPVSCEVVRRRESR